MEFIKKIILLQIAFLNKAQSCYLSDNEGLFTDMQIPVGNNPVTQTRDVGDLGSIEIWCQLVIDVIYTGDGEIELTYSDIDHVEFEFTPPSTAIIGTVEYVLLEAKLVDNYSACKGCIFEEVDHSFNIIYEGDCEKQRVEMVSPTQDLFIYDLASMSGLQTIYFEFTSYGCFNCDIEQPTFQQAWVSFTIDPNEPKKGELTIDLDESSCCELGDHTFRLIVPDLNYNPQIIEVYFTVRIEAVVDCDSASFIFPAFPEKTITLDGGPGTALINLSSITTDFEQQYGDGFCGDYSYVLPYQDFFTVDQSGQTLTIFIEDAGSSFFSTDLYLDLSWSNGFGIVNPTIYTLTPYCLSWSPSIQKNYLCSDF